MNKPKVNNNPDLNRDEILPDLCPACGGSGKANVNKNGDVEKDNPQNLACGWCLGSGFMSY